MESKGEMKEKDTRKRWLVGLLIGVNLIILLPIAANIMMNPDWFIRQTQPSSEKPHLSVDGEGNAHVHFISWIDEYGDQTYNVAYARIDGQGGITDGPKFVDDYPMNTYPEESEKYLWDSAGNDHFFFSKFDSPGGFYWGDECLKHTVIDRHGQVVVDNNTIASFPRRPDSQHGPAIFGIKLVRRSDDIHIAWYLNAARGNYFEVYYMKINTESEILVPPTRLYVYDGEPLIPYFLVFLGIPLSSVAAYFVLSRRISSTDYSENTMRSPLTRRTKLAGIVLLVSVLVLVLTTLFIAPPVLGILIREPWGSTTVVFVGFMIALAIPVVFLAGFTMMLLDKDGKTYLWHQQAVKSGFAASLLATYLSFMMISSIMSPANSLGGILFWVIVAYPIFLFVATGLATERSLRVLTAWRKEKKDEIVEESDGVLEIRDDEE